MKEIVVISGKGGTGKTSITASFAYLGGADVVVADCDVDAADMHLLLQPEVVNLQRSIRTIVPNAGNVLKYAVSMPSASLMACIPLIP
jgi:MinD superfamily P-loop ATPase